MAKRQDEKKEAILLMAYGSPDRDEDVEAYYTHIRGGRKPTPSELENLLARYRMIGGRSPLLGITQSTARKLEQKLGERGNDIRVYAGMKHWHPFIAEAFEQISRDGITSLTAIALAPHYSKMSIGSYQEAVSKANSEHGGKVELTFVNEWHLNRVFIEIWKKRIEQALNDKFAGQDRDKIFFLFTAHSLPERILTWKDPYKDQLLETADRLASELGLTSEQHSFAFQSAGHTSEPWLGPDILDKLKDIRANNWSRVLIIPIGFVSDHLEILYDIDVEARELAKEGDIQLERTESFNDSDDFIKILYSVWSQSNNKKKKEK
ncbi:MAG TPA: ferrochelatase [Nitrososphaerales archaeon]|nr:ferrochelatase [Nitrososphaerales archaeon]